MLDFYLGIPILNALALLRSRRSYPASPARIGILLNPALGDTLLASAAVLDVRAAFPRARLILFATQDNAAAARLLPQVDAIEILSLLSPLRSLRTLRGAALDLMLDFTAWQRITAIYTMLSGANYSIGFHRAGQHRGRAYNESVPHLGNCHELENLRRLTAVFGRSVNHDPRLRLPDWHEQQIASGGGAAFVFHPWAAGSRARLREWPEENWIGLAKELNAHGCSFILTGSPADEARCEAMCGRMRALKISASVLIGRDGLAGIACTLGRSAMLVSVNTGIMHLGAILGVPTVSLNGPTSSIRWGPIGPRVMNVAPKDGSGGYLDLGFEFHRGSADAMQRIDVASVLEAVRLLSRDTFHTAKDRNRSHEPTPLSRASDPAQRMRMEASCKTAAVRTLREP